MQKWKIQTWTMELCVRRSQLPERRKRAETDCHNYPQKIQRSTLILGKAIQSESASIGN